MKFFIPGIEKEVDRDHFYKRIIEQAEQAGNAIYSKPVHSVTYYRDGKLVKDTVGEWCSIVNENVIMILEGNFLFFVYTEHRGIWLGTSILVQKGSGCSVKYFDD